MKLLKNNGKTAHIYYSGKYYHASDNGRETLIFPSNSKGEIVDSLEVGGSIGATLMDIIGDFPKFLYNFE